MGDRLHISALGSRIAVEMDHLDRLTRVELRTVWSRCDVSAEGDPSLTLTPTPEGFEVIAERMANSLTTLATDADQRVIEAAAVATPHGDTIVMLGTRVDRVRALIALRRRYGYVASTTVGIRDDLGVQAMPGPLSIPTHSGPPRTVSPDALGLHDAPSSLRLHHVVELAPSIDHHDAPIATPIDDDAFGCITAIVYRDANSLPTVFAELFAGEPSGVLERR